MDTPVESDDPIIHHHHSAESSREIIKRLTDISYNLIDPFHLNDLYKTLKEVENRFKLLVPNQRDLINMDEIKNRTREESSKKRKRK